MAVHLLQLVSHMLAVHIVGVTNVVHTQVVTNQDVPLSRLPQARQQMLQQGKAVTRCCTGIVSLYRNKF